MNSTVTRNEEIKRIITRIDIGQINTVSSQVAVNVAGSVGIIQSCVWFEIRSQITDQAYR